MTALNASNLVAAGTAPTFVNSSASDTAPVGSGTDTFVVYRNTGGSSVDVVLVAPGNTSYGSANPDPTVTVAATTGEVWIPLRKEFIDPLTPGRAKITVASGSGSTLKVAVVRVS